MTRLVVEGLLVVDDTDRLTSDAPIHSSFP